MIAEPKFHVSADNFQESLNIAKEAGFIVSNLSGVRFSFAAVLVKE